MCISKPNNLEVVSGYPFVWLFGSSIVKRAFVAAVRHPEGSSPGLPAVLWWQGYRDLPLKMAEAKLASSPGAGASLL